MKTIFLSVVLPVASLFTYTAAFVSLGPFPNTLHIGDTYTLNWTATANYTYTIWLVLDNQAGNQFTWDKILPLDKGLHYSTLEGSYTWTVPQDQNFSRQADYALWLNGLSIPFDGETYYGVTDRFSIASPDHPTSSPTASTSTSPGATSSATVSGSPSETSSAVPSSSHHESLSGGAIAGIVIGCILALAIIVSAVLLSVWRKKRSGVQKREAAARASRLAPVMQNSSPYEMHGRQPQVTKETDV